MEEEIRALEKNETWVLQELAPEKKPISYKWILPFNSDGFVQQFKACLVIQGDHQLKGFDYSKAFAPVAKMRTIRHLLSVAISKRWELQQLDVNIAFLHGDLDKEVYMRLPPNFSCSTPTNSW